MTDEELALLETLDEPDQEGVTLIITLDPETQEVQNVEDLT